MKTTKNIKASLLAITTLSLLGFTSPVLTATAHADESAPGEALGKCPYSLLLQKSVEAQRAYLVKVDRARVGNQIASPEEVAANGESTPADATERPAVAWVSFAWGSRAE
ncbi:hypothetical protein KP004_20995 [Geomonas oryzisoli]|uniref:DUF4148 domain-containing protein n=1 Tax=Geomonas oryzisoli TaxID=2847992 RepID=A0ABX8J959_9BACT|nr:hypothetical protein [Geomonas oryzisoli]QWV93601.1 hypothetical protein KP004_20995 [Geomonas oryzisoli]